MTTFRTFLLGLSTVGLWEISDYLLAVMGFILSLSFLIAGIGWLYTSIGENFSIEMVLAILYGITLVCASPLPLYYIINIIAITVL